MVFTDAFYVPGYTYSFSLNRSPASWLFFNKEELRKVNKFIKLQNEKPYINLYASGAIDTNIFITLSSQSDRYMTKDEVDVLGLLYELRVRK